jgi:hypothetical protein
MATVDEPTAKLKIFFATYAPADDDRAFQLWLDAWSEAARRPALRGTSLRLNEEWQRSLAEVMNDCAAPGSPAADEPGSCAWRVLSFLDGLVLQVIAHRANISRATAIAWAIELTEREVGLEPGTIERA